MGSPLISVVMCTWNGARYLEEQINSILSQAYRPIEIIVSDDASTDGTAEILRKYMDNPLFRIFFQTENLGLSANFSFAAGKTGGEFIAFSDQDDIWLDHKLDTLYKSIGDYQLAYSNSELVDETGKSMNKTTADIRKMYSGIDGRSYIFYSVVWGHGMLVRRSLLLDSLPVPAPVHHDVWLAFKALVSGGIVYVDEVLTMYRQHSYSSSKTVRRFQPARSNAVRYKDFRKRLEWMRLMMEHDSTGNKAFYRELISLYAKKEDGRFVWPLFFFMVRHRSILFRFSNRNFLSQVIEIAKQSRGEKAS